MKKSFEVNRGNVTVNITETTKITKGKEYTYFVFSEYTPDGTRKQHWLTTVDAAKEKAGEVADKLAGRKSLQLDDYERTEYVEAQRLIAPYDLGLFTTCSLFAQAMQILEGDHTQLLLACSAWKHKNPTKPFTPKGTKEAVETFLAGKKKQVSTKRYNALKSYLENFAKSFPDTTLDQVEPVAVRNFVDGQDWEPKTRNEVVGAIGQLYKEAQLQGWVAEGFSATKGLKRLREVRGAIEIFEPFEVQQLLERLTLKDAALVPFFCLWLFSGLRKEEAARLNWQAINRGLKTGFVYIEAKQTKTGEARSVPICENLKAWLTLHRRESGPVLPAEWLKPTKRDENRLSQLTRHVSKLTGVQWRNNAPRHSYAPFI